MAAGIFAAVPAALVALTLVMRSLPVTNPPQLLLSVASPYTTAAILAVLAVKLVRIRTALSIIAAILVAISAVIQLNWYYLGKSSSVDSAADIRVLASNLRRGEVDAASFSMLAGRIADVITVAELTPEALLRLREAGINESFPHSHLIPAPGASGIGIWSRFPFRVLAPMRGNAILMPAVRLQVSGVRVGPILASVHVTSPVAGGANTIEDWAYDLVNVRAQMEHFAAAAGPGAVIVGGDFNSTPDVRQFRDLLTNGYRDAVEQSGSGFAPTFPSDTWYPPMITIDHVVLKNADATSAETFDVRGSDHRAVLVNVRIPSQLHDQ